MKYDFSKLKSSHFLDLVEFYLGERTIDCLESSDSTTIYLGESMLFYVTADGVVKYVGGAPEHLSDKTILLLKDKLQSAISLECVVLESV